jgi:hypothetical protein
MPYQGWGCINEKMCLKQKHTEQPFSPRSHREHGVFPFSFGFLGGLRVSVVKVLSIMHLTKAKFIKSQVLKAFTAEIAKIAEKTIKKSQRSRRALR